MARKKYIDKRNWKEYNEKLVKCGELYLTFNFLDSWDSELRQLNRDKVGRKFKYPWSFIKFIMLLHIIFHLPYRQLEGFFRRISMLIPEVEPIDFTSIWKRGTKLNIDLADTISKSNDTVVIALDSSGIKVTNRGEWMREMWKVHRGWIKVHLAVDVKTKEIVGLEVTDERVGDNRMFAPLIDQTEKNLPGRKIEKALADGAFDSKSNFNTLADKKIESGLKIRENASTRARGSPSRAKHVRELKELGYNAWKEKYDYGKRWAVEGVFSAVKRMTGEHISATKTENMYQEVKFKFAFYNILINAI
jgi:hypothetical protein